MMMYAVAEEKPLGIYDKVLEILAAPVTFVIGYDILHGLPYRQVDFAILRPDYITAIFCRLSEMIDIFFLLKRKFIPSRNLISHHFQIRKFINQIPEIPFRLFRSAAAR